MSISNKHKEIMKQWEDLKGRGLSHKMIGNFISASLIEQLEELERWMEDKRKEEKTFTYDEPNLGCDIRSYNLALNDILSHLHMEKDIIKKQ